MFRKAKIYLKAFSSSRDVQMHRNVPRNFHYISIWRLEGWDHSVNQNMSLTAVLFLQTQNNISRVISYIIALLVI